MGYRPFFSAVWLAKLALVGVSACSDPAAGTAQIGVETTSTTAVTIWVDASQAIAANPHIWSASVGTGTASLALRGDVQSQYKIGNREAGFQRVRGHGVLNDDMGIYQGPGAYDWTKLDTYLTAIAAAGMRPIMEMDFMPTALAQRRSSRDIYNDATNYRQLIAAVVRHCVDRFGIADVSRWYWEIWNEPDYIGFWRGDPASRTSARMSDYYRLYDDAVAAITSVIPDALVGGPAATNPGPIGEFLQHCKSAGTRVTFASSHHYPGGAGGDWADASALVADNARRVSAILGAGYSTSQVMSFNTEWSSSYAGQGGGTSDAVISMDNHWNVGFILKAAKLLSDASSSGPAPTVFSYWALSDVFDESTGPSGSYILAHDGGNLPFGSVFGLMTAQGVRKAAFNAFKMLNRLGPIRLQSSGGAAAAGVDAMATMSEAGDEIQVLVYDQYAKLDTTGTDTVTIDLYNIPAALAGKQVFVTRFVVDESHSNPYGVWESQGRPTNPSEAEWQAMRAAQHLSALPVAVTTLGTSYNASITMNRQSGTLLIVGLARPVIGRDAFLPIEGEDYDGQSGASRIDGDDADLGQTAAVTRGGSVFYDVVDFGEAGADAVQLRVQAPAATTVALFAGPASAPPAPAPAGGAGVSIGSCSISATGRAWTTQSCRLTHTTDVHTLYLVFAGAANLNWLQFDGPGAAR
jgi:xylan 1,4-beta-xylosidase